MIVSYPNNPVTSIASDSFYERLITLAGGNDIVALHDNAYSELFFDGRECGSYLRFQEAREEGMMERNGILKKGDRIQW